jgi:uncharacterized Zn-binding protein involved in type VI secretion
MPSKPAARTFDLTTHGSVLGFGSPTVKVNARDAIRLSDPLVCPQVVPIPHTDGVVQLGGGGALTVLINRKPAIAIDARARCHVPPLNKVATASGNVFYDVTSTLAGLPVTQDDDGTIHIGDHITIKAVRKRVIHKTDGSAPVTIEDDDYAAHVLADIAKIASTDVGKERLRRLDQSGHDVTISPNTDTNKNAFSAAADGNGARDPTKGSDVNIYYTPEEWPPDSRAESTGTGAEGDVILFHEMNHADHQTHGRQASTTRDPAFGDYDNPEEFNSIEGDENKYRRARGFQERHNHRGN